MLHYVTLCCTLGRFLHLTPVHGKPGEVIFWTFDKNSVLSKFLPFCEYKEELCCIFVGPENFLNGRIIFHSIFSGWSRYTPGKHDFFFLNLQFFSFSSWFFFLFNFFCSPGFFVIFQVWKQSNISHHLHTRFVLKTPKTKLI